METKQIAAKLIRFSLPLILSGVLQQLYLWADAIIVGHYIGEDALAAIGVTGSITNCILTAMIGFTTGLAVIAAQRFGAGDNETVGAFLSDFVMILTGVFLVISVAGILFSRPFLQLLKTPENIFSDADIYLRIILIGVPFLCVYNLYAAILRAVGNSKASFFAVIISSVSNVILDLWFVKGLHMGVRGAAVATVLSQIAMMVFLVLYASRKYELFRILRNRRPMQWSVVLLGCRYAMPIMIQQGIVAGGGLILQGFMNGFGSHTVAAITSAYRVDLIMLLPIIHLGAAISTMVAQNKGAGDYEKMRSYALVGIGMSLFVSFLLVLLMYNFGGDIVKIFGIEPEAVEIGRRFFRSIALYYFLFGLATALRGAAEGNGKVIYSGIVAVLTLSVRIGLSFLMAERLGNMTIAHAEGLSWLFMVLCYMPYFMLRIRKTKTRSV